MWLWLATSALAAEPQLRAHDTSIFDRLLSLVGIAVFIGFAWVLSENRKRIKWRPVLWGVGLQLAFGVVILSPAVSAFFFTVINGSVAQLLEFSGKGATFVFQSTEPHFVDVGFAPGDTQQFVGQISPPVKTFAFWILPTIVFFSALMSALYHLGIMQFVVKGIAWVMVRTLGTSGAESLSAAGNIFVGQTEAPLLIKPFVGVMTRSELMAVMTGGFATVAGGVLGAYVAFLGDIPNIAGHLVVASIISAPAALAVAKVMVPEIGEPTTLGRVVLPSDSRRSNVMEAVAEGATEGMKLALNVAAMLIAIVALVAMFDFFIGLVPVTFCEVNESTRVAAGYTCAAGTAEPLSLSLILGVLFAPVAFFMGVPWAECAAVGRLLGEKIVLTEFVAYINLGELIKAGELSERGAVIASYALCGFANFASIGIQIGGIGGIAPKRIPELSSLGFRAMVAGVIAACMTGSIAGLML